MTGALPWREEWAPYFGSPEGLLKALRSRWNRMCEAQLDVRTGEDVFARHPRPAAPYPGRHPRHPAQGQRDPGRGRRQGARADRLLAGADPAQGAGRTILGRTGPQVTLTLSETVQSPPGRRLDRLSRRELEVLRLIAEGLSNAAIAAELYLAGKTVETVCSSIFRKLELHPSDHVNRRVLAVLTAAARGRVLQLS